MVTMRDTKDPKGGKVRLLPGRQNSSGFQLITVEQDSANYKKTRVKLSYQGKEGYVGYDEKYLALNKGAAAKKPQAKKPIAQPTRGRKPAPQPAKQQANNADLNRIFGNQGANSGRANNPAANPTSGARKPRVRRVPTPPSR